MIESGGIPLPELAVARGSVPVGAVRITTDREAQWRDQHTIAAGSPSFELMAAAGTAAANTILARWPDSLSDGVAIYAGAGNNGGDAYIVAAQLARAGVAVRLHATAPPRTADAVHAASLARLLHHGEPPTGRERLVVDGVLGTGQRGELSGVVRDACLEIEAAHLRQAVVVALDLPTGIEATSGTGVMDAVTATATLAFGTLKRAHVIARSHVGDTIVLDIGLTPPADDDPSWWLADAATLAPKVPAIPWSAHKGMRGRVALVGGAVGMAGAITLAARASAASGVGLVHAWIGRESLVPVQIGAVHAIAHEWPATAALWSECAASCTALGIGPGMGRDVASRRVLFDVLAATGMHPVVLDADALTLLSSADDERPPDGLAAERIRALLNGRDAVCTPHPGEFARLLGKTSIEELGDLAQRATLASDFARRAALVVLLKGTPTIVATPDGAPPAIVPRGSPVLATGGSGDVLTGMIATLLAQGVAARDAAVVSAWVHGVAAEGATRRARTVRGVTLDAVLEALPDAWRQLELAASLPPHVLAELAAPLTGALPSADSAPDDAAARLAQSSPSITMYAPPP